MPLLFGKTRAQEAQSAHVAATAVSRDPDGSGGVVYGGVCSKIHLCGWAGPRRRTREEARADCRAHEAEANARDGFAPLGETARPR